MDTPERLSITTPDGLTLAADRAGPNGAPAVVLLHGGGQTRHSWGGELIRLAQHGYHVVSYDARGHGESEWASDGVYSVDKLANDLEAVLARVGRPLALVGASMGGITSLYAVGRGATPIADVLVLVDIVPRPARAGADRILQFMNGNPDGFGSLDEAADAVAAYSPARPRPSNPAGLMRNLRLRDNGRLYWHWDPRVIQPVDYEDLHPMTEQALAMAPNITVPTLLVRGGLSDVVDHAGVEDMRALIPQTEVCDVPGAGHMVAGDDNSTFHAGIALFLEQHLPLNQTVR